MQQAPSKINVVAFDLDDTLAPSKSPMTPLMGRTLSRLLELVEVCIISGGRLEQFETQVLAGLRAPEASLERLHLMPTCGTRYFARRDGQWVSVYSEDLAQDDKARIIQTLERVSRSLGYWEERPWGDIIEDRGSQITYSALGQSAPLAEKSAWDPHGEKKLALGREVSRLLPDLEVRGGGSTSIDVTRKGIDKAYGIRKLLSQLHLELPDLLFVGDRLDEAGNDYPVLAMGAHCVAVTDWHKTVTVINELTEWLDRGGGSVPPRITLVPYVQ